VKKESALWLVMGKKKTGNGDVKIRVEKRNLEISEEDVKKRQKLSPKKWGNYVLENGEPLGLIQLNA